MADTLYYNAQAPYNFVPLLSGVLWGEISKAEQNEYIQHVQQNGRNTGYLDLTITSKTPIFTGGNGEFFFAPTGTPVLSGSTVRGMLKNIFKIVTAGTMRINEDFENKHLYFRGLAAKGSYGDHYKSLMSKSGTVDNARRTDSKAKAGFLIKIKETQQYCICPAQREEMEYADINNKKENDIEWGDKSNDYACAVHTGPMKNKKHYIIIKKPNWQKKLKVSPKVIEEYINDKNRKGFDLLQSNIVKRDQEAVDFSQCSDIDFVVPCCYMEVGGEVKHFGYGRYYRIPYEKSVADHIPTALKGVNKADSADKEDSVDRADLADMIFGRKELWGSRVFVEHAPLIEGGRRLSTSFPQPLMSPKPTSFQLYLEQNSKTKIHHWDENANIRGYKLYWHQADNNQNWQISPGQDPVEGMSKITPLASGSKFQGRVRFVDLSDVELGALLRVFHLSKNNPDICFKIGMGKPIGLGSVALKSELHLFDQKQRYNGMFAQENFSTGDITADKDVWQKYLDSFDTYLHTNMDSKSYQDYKDMEKELKTMLNWKVTKRDQRWQDKMAYMKIDDDGSDQRYTDRAILVKPSKY